MPAILLAAIATSLVLASSLPGSAHTASKAGTVYTQALVTTPYMNPDWVQFMAAQCGDVTDGLSQAFVNAVPFRGHRASVKVTGSSQGGAADRAAQVWIGFANCLDPNGYTVSYGQGGRATAGRPAAFTVPSNAHVIVVQNVGSAVGLTYEVDFSH